MGWFTGKDSIFSKVSNAYQTAKQKVVDHPYLASFGVGALTTASLYGLANWYFAKEPEPTFVEQAQEKAKEYAQQKAEGMLKYYVLRPMDKYIDYLVFGAVSYVGGKITAFTWGKVSNTRLGNAVGNALSYFSSSKEDAKEDAFSEQLSQALRSVQKQAQDTSSKIEIAPDGKISIVPVGKPAEQPVTREELLQLFALMQAQQQPKPEVCALELPADLRVKEESQLSATNSGSKGNVMQ